MRRSLSLFRFLKPYTRWATLAPLLMALEVGMDLMQPRLVARIVDQGIAQLDLSVVLNAGLLMIGLALIGAIGGVGCTYYSVLASQGFGTDLRGALFRKVQSLSFANIDELEPGQLVTRLTNDVTQVQEVVFMLLRVMVRSPLMMIGSLAMAISTSPRLALMFVVLMPLVAGILAWVVSRAYPQFGGVQRRLDAINTVLQENLAGVRVVKAFVRRAHERSRFGRANDGLMEQTIRAARIVAVTDPALIFALNLGIIGAVWFGGIQVTNGTMRTGDLIAFINYVMRTLMSLGFFGMLAMRVARAQASSDRIEEVLANEPHVLDAPDACETFAPRGRVAFEGVTFGYGGDGAEPVLRDVDFAVEAGETVAILGATGSGKSSLVHLIPRFYDVAAGRVTIGGVDVRDVGQVALRRTIGVALQELILFSGTIRDNIRYGRPDAPDDAVVAAAQAAQAHSFITGFPDGYDTAVGQRGVNLSGGQKQRIAIARALLMEPAILILDDSTSSVDIETEFRIREALRQRGAGRTTIVIAQRISAVLAADKIIVLEDGRIAGVGTHRALMDSCPIYREIYDSQLGDGVKADAQA